MDDSDDDGEEFALLLQLMLAEQEAEAIAFRMSS
jgi:hypothetical protein